jgi:hypothetical protein
MEQRAAISFCVELKETVVVKCVRRGKFILKQVCLDGINGSKKGQTRYKTMNGKAVLQLPEQKNQRK